MEPRGLAVDRRNAARRRDARRARLDAALRGAYRREHRFGRFAVLRVARLVRGPDSRRVRRRVRRKRGRCGVKEAATSSRLLYYSARETWQHVEITRDREHRKAVCVWRPSSGVWLWSSI